MSYAITEPPVNRINGHRSRPIMDIEAAEAERYVLGSILQGADDDRLISEMFAPGGRRMLYEALLFCRAEGLLETPGTTRDERQGALVTNISRVSTAVAAEWPNADPPQHELQQCVMVAVNEHLIDRYADKLVRSFSSQRLKSRISQIAAAVDRGVPVEEIDVDLSGCVPEAEPTLLRGITSEEFFAEEYTTDYLVDGILTAGEPAIIGGASKSLKTSLAIDLAISLATTKPFVGRFPVTRRSKVGLISGESGKRTIQTTAKRVCKDKDLIASSTGIVWEFEVPHMMNPRHERAVRSFIKRHGIEVLICDPVYLMLGDVGQQSSNLMAMGAVLRPFAQMIADLGALLILIHHIGKGAAKASSLNGEPADLSDLSMSGFAEFARQWLLVARRQKYELGSGQHRLWLTVGGSAGHSGLYGLNVDEGRITDDGGRKWEIECLDAPQARASDEAHSGDRKAEQEERKHDVARQKVLAYLKDNPAGDTESMIRTKAKPGIGKARFKDLLAVMLDDGEIEETMIRKHTRDENGYRLKT